MRFEDKLTPRYQQFALLVIFSPDNIYQVISIGIESDNYAQTELERVNSFESGAVQSTLNFLPNKDFRQ